MKGTCYLTTLFQLIVSNVSTLVNCEFGRERCWPMLSHYPSSYVEGLGETIKNVGKDSRSPGRDPKPRHPV